MAPNGKQMESSLLGAEELMRFNRLIHVDPENMSHEIFRKPFLKDFCISLFLNCSEMTFNVRILVPIASFLQRLDDLANTFGSDSCRAECETKGSDIVKHFNTCTYIHILRLYP